MHLTGLLVLHVLGAVAGIGPLFALGPIRRAALASSDEQAARLLEIVRDIERKVVGPVVMIVQPITGVALIFATHRATGFLQREWLPAGIGLYVVLTTVAFSVVNSSVARMAVLARAGKSGSEEFAAVSASERRARSLVLALAAAITVLMVWRPGDGVVVTALARALF